jgi:serine/threonine protein kinase
MASKLQRVNGEYVLTTKSNEYTISNTDMITPLGRDCYSIKYKAANKKGEIVAIKTIPASCGLSENKITQGIDIMEKIAKIPNVGNLLQCVDSTKDSQCYYIIMPYYDSGNLTSLINTGQIKDEQQAIEYFRQVCYGIQILHSQNIIHRDLKTDSIFVSKYEDPPYPYKHYLTISDFELSKVGLYDMTRNVGTSYTMAPEVKYGDYGPNVDVYSLGCILYKMLTKHEPFPGISDLEIFKKKNIKEKKVDSSFSQPISKFTMKILEGCCNMIETIGFQ